MSPRDVLFARLSLLLLWARHCCCCCYVIAVSPPANQTNGKMWPFSWKTGFKPSLCGSLWQWVTRKNGPTWDASGGWTLQWRQRFKKGCASVPRKMKAAGGTHLGHRTALYAWCQVCVCVYFSLVSVNVWLGKRRDAAGEECSHGWKVGVKTTMFTDLRADLPSLPPPGGW